MIDDHSQCRFHHGTYIKCFCSPLSDEVKKRVDEYYAAKAAGMVAELRARSIWWRDSNKDDNEKPK